MTIKSFERWIFLGIFMLHIFRNGKFLFDVESSKVSRKILFNFLWAVNLNWVRY